MAFVHNNNSPQSGDIPEELISSKNESPFAAFEVPPPAPVPLPTFGSSHGAPMPSPRGRNPLKFKGKNIEEFLAKFEYYAEYAKLTNPQKCREIRMYFAT